MPEPPPPSPAARSAPPSDIPFDIPSFLRRSAAEPGPPDQAPQAAPAPPAAREPVVSKPAPTGPRAPRRAPTGPLAFSRGRVDWTRDPEALRQGRLDGLPHAVAAGLGKAAGMPEVAALAAMLGQAPLVVALALLAGSEAPGNRHAERFARQILAGADAALLDAARQAVDL